MPHALHPHQPAALFSSAHIRQLEAAALALHPQPSLMQRAGLACAQLAQAIAPHAQHIWLLCGPGNNGGDGLAAAAHLAAAGRQVTVTWLGQPHSASADTLAALQQAQRQPITWSANPPPLGPQDLVIDALLGLGLGNRPVDSRVAALLQHSYTSSAHCLAVDLPSGLHADTGQWLTGYAPRGRTDNSSRHTLSLLGLKPGLFTAQGRDAAGQVWWDDLGLAALPVAAPLPQAWLTPAPAMQQRLHASHKGSFGDVLVLGGQGLGQGLGQGAAMQGAAILAATAALHYGAGRVFLHLLDGGHTQLLPQQPDIMLRSQTAALAQLASSTVVCGCGGGSSIAPLLPKVLEGSARLVLDADALNVIASDSLLRQRLHNRQRLQLPTILTPHPLEAARLLDCSTEQVQANRLEAAHTLAKRLGCTVLLKGSGSITASPGRAALHQPHGQRPPGHCRYGGTSWPAWWQRAGRPSKGVGKTATTPPAQPRGCTAAWPTIGQKTSP